MKALCGFMSVCAIVCLQVEEAQGPDSTWQLATIAITVRCAFLATMQSSIMLGHGIVEDDTKPSTAQLHC